jgi:hypothetical protein
MRNPRSASGTWLRRRRSGGQDDLRELLEVLRRMNRERVAVLLVDQHVELALGIATRAARRTGAKRPRPARRARAYNTGSRLSLEVIAGHCEVLANLVRPSAPHRDELPVRLKRERLDAIRV